MGPFDAECERCKRMAQQVRYCERCLATGVHTPAVDNSKLCAECENHVRGLMRQEAQEQVPQPQQPAAEAPGQQQNINLTSLPKDLQGSSLTADFPCARSKCSGRLVVTVSPPMPRVEPCPSCGFQYLYCAGTVRAANKRAVQGVRGQKHWHLRYYVAGDKNVEDLVEFTFTDLTYGQKEPELRARDAFAYVGTSDGVSALIFNMTLGTHWINDMFDVEPAKGGCCGCGAAAALIALSGIAYGSIKLLSL